MFGAAPEPKNDEGEGSEDEDEVTNNDDLDFEPIVSLPEVSFLFHFLALQRSRHEGSYRLCMQ